MESKENKFKFDYELYTPDRKLLEDEYLLKIRTQYSTPTAFMTLLTQKGQLPKAFEQWDEYNYSTNERVKPPIYVFKETFRNDWKIVDWRFGESQNWASMRHPEGFLLEIKLQNLLQLIKKTTVTKGVLQGKYKWTYGNLIKE